MNGCHSSVTKAPGTCVWRNCEWINILISQGFFEPPPSAPQKPVCAGLPNEPAHGPLVGLMLSGTHFGALEVMLESFLATSPYGEG